MFVIVYSTDLLTSELLQDMCGSLYLNNVSWFKLNELVWEFLLKPGDIYDLTTNSEIISDNKLDISWQR